MTENRCIEVLKKMKHMFTETCAKIDENTALDMAVEAIKEIQQYRAIGTVEGYVKAIQSSMEYYNLMKEYKAKVDEFEAIGTIDEFKALKEKSVAKKVKGISLTHEGRVGNCPVCGKFVRHQEQTVYCSCEQKLDWSE